MNTALPGSRLMLRVISRGSEVLREGPVKLFDERGGTIGRGADNDWVLDDPHRFLSSSHAAIYFDQGEFHLVDTSTNGVLINEGAQPDQGRSVALKNGDILQLGNYAVRVSLIAPAITPGSAVASRPATDLHGDATPDAANPAIDPLLLLKDAPAPAVPAAKPAAESMRRNASWVVSVPANLSGGRTLDPLILLGGVDITSEAGVKRHSGRPHGASQRDDAPIIASHFVPPAASALPEDWFEDGIGASAPAGRARVGAGAEPGRVDAAACLAAFLRGAGIHLAGDPLQELEHAGRLLREVLSALSALRERRQTSPAAAPSISTNTRGLDHVE